MVGVASLAFQSHDIVLVDCRGATQVLDFEGNQETFFAELCMLCGWVGGRGEGGEGGVGKRKEYGNYL